MSTPIVWSPQQDAFLKWAEYRAGSCVLEAVAGAGKSTTLIEAAHRISGQVAIVAYNKKIAEELKEKVKLAGMDWRKCQAGTVHSFCYSTYRKAVPNVSIDENKMEKIVIQLLDPDLGAFENAVIKLVGYAKQRAFGVVGPLDNHFTWNEMAEHFDVWDVEDEDSIPKKELISCAIASLKRSIDQREVIDFDDMIYMPLIHKCRFWRFDVVMVDEAQDTNPARRAAVRAMLQRGGRVIAVGDRHQAIYGFTGADSDSLDLIKRDFNAIDLPLTTSYRCPKEVVAFAQQWVRHIEAHESAPEGSVSRVMLPDFFSHNDLTEKSAVLCRNTKPLVSLALQLIRRGTRCRVEGRDIAANLKKLATRWKVKGVHTLLQRLDAYLQRETTKLLAKKQELRLAIVEDTVETIRVVVEKVLADGKDQVTDVVAFLDELFGDNVTDMLVLSTIHKSKGREWETVYWLDRFGTCPSRWARQAWQIEQEHNLCYVAATRAKSSLIEIIMPTKETTNEQSKTQGN